MKSYYCFLIILLLFFGKHTRSQEDTFEYLLKSPMNEIVLDLIEDNHFNIYFCGHLSSIDQPNDLNGFIVKLDKYGRFKDSIHIVVSEKSNSINKLLLKGNNEFALIDAYFDNSGFYRNSGIFLCNMDSLLHLTSYRYYNFPDSLNLLHVDANLDSSGNLLSGITFVLPPQNPRAYLYEFNSNFDSTKARFFPGESKLITHPYKLPDHQYWFINSILNRYELLDSNFTAITTQKVPEGILSNYGLTWDSDSTFYLLGGQAFSSLPYTLAFIRQNHPIDTTGYLFNHWRVSDTIDLPAAWNGLDFQNKDSIFIGGTRNMWIGYYNPWPSWFVVLQTDSMLNIRWERFYGGDAYYMMGKVVATHDGGCLVAGTRYDYLNTTEQETDIIILKLNSEGLILGNPENPGIKMHEAIVYPNPGNEEIKVRIAVQHKQSLFELLDLNGRLVLKENFTGTEGTVNTTFLPTGTYIYKITSENGLYESGKWVKQ